MEKLRVILADEDYNYLAPLELKFIEELGNNIELEVITEKDYFGVFFSMPQTMDILVVSERLYFPDIQKHNIVSTFILMEEMDDEKSQRSGITEIFKYSSTKEIYNHIRAMSPFLRNLQEQKGGTKVILVYSPVGGSGKTTLALGMAAYYARNYKKVLYIDAEIMNTFQQYLDTPVWMPTAAYGEFLSKSRDVYGQIKKYIQTEVFDYLPPFSSALSLLDMDYSFYGNVIQSAKEAGEYDLIIVDTDTVFDAHKAALISQADKVLLVVTQEKTAVYTMNILMKNMSHSDSDKYICLCNDYDEKKSNALVSGEITKSFIVADYVRHFEEEATLSPVEIAKKTDIQKAALLIV